MTAGRPPFRRPSSLFPWGCGRLKRGKPADKYGTTGYWHFLLSFWEHRDDPDVLFLFFEDMQADLPAAVRQVAEFIGVGAGDEALQAKVVTQSTLEFMQVRGPRPWPEREAPRGLTLQPGGSRSACQRRL